MKLCMVRHGQTVENANQIVQGQLPGHLSKLGIQQAKKLAKQLKDESFDQMWSSDLKRCTDTAKYILDLHPDLKLQTSDAIREINYGDLQGKPASNIKWATFENDQLLSRFPNGETRLELAQRTVAFMNQLLKDFPEQKILIVTHGGPLKTVMACLKDLPLAKTIDEDLPNATVNYVEITKALKLPSKP